MAIPRPGAKEYRSGYQVSDGSGGWIDISEIDDLETLRMHLRAAIDTIEDLDEAITSATFSVKSWRHNG